MNQDKPLAIYEICAKLGLGRSSVYSLLRSGQLPSVRAVPAGKQYRVTRLDIEIYLKRISHDQKNLR